MYYIYYMFVHKLMQAWFSVGHEVPLVETNNFCYFFNLTEKHYHLIIGVGCDCESWLDYMIYNVILISFAAFTFVYLFRGGCW